MEIFAGSLLVKWLAKFFVGKSYLQNSRETLYPNFMTELYLQNFTRVSLTRENTQKTCFSLKNNLKNFEKHGWYKSLPKANKKKQKSFWFDPHMVEHTRITFEHVQSHKWNKHSLNIRLVCCVCVSNVE